MRKRAILFDAGHTLIEPADPVLQEAAQIARLAASPREIQRAFRRAIRALNHAPKDDPPAFRDVVAAELLRLGVRSPAAEESFWAVLDRHNAARVLWVQAIEGAVRGLAALHARGVRIGVVSNSDGFVESYLDRAGLLDYIDVVVDSQLVGVEKPDPRIFRCALERLGIEPDGVPFVPFVGDRYDVDVLGAQAVGLRGILFDPEEDAPPDGCEILRRLEAVVDCMSDA